MKIILFVLIITSTSLSFSQSKTNLFVKYKSYKSNSMYYNYLFTQNSVFSSLEVDIRAKYSKGFPIYDNNGKSRTENDTVVYNTEFNNFINSIKNKKTTSQTVTFREHNSNVSKMLVSIDYGYKDYIVIDTLQNLENWQLQQDTITFMKFKCQKALINVNNELFSAWFTTDLVYNSGPENFLGLPGLILKVSNESKTIGFEAIEIKNPFEGEIPNFKEYGKPISRKEWLAIISERNKKAYEASNNYIQQLKKQMGN